MSTGLPAFYEDLMRNEDYPGKRAPSLQSNSTARKAPPPGVVVAGEDDEDDHEPQYLKQEGSGMAEREILEIDDSPAPPPVSAKDKQPAKKTSRSKEATGGHMAPKRKRTATHDAVSENDDEIPLAQLKEKKAKHEMKAAALEVKEAAFEVAELEREIAVRRKK